ncbi:hypothetical protein AXF19_07085 [Selenomonas sp. oral taxon 126]|uniref:DUF502 domain-containing protein n=1 Tax=Selenomonas sp. oral taxon 126 TaxID=712528 RepID=UPI0008077650|nr:DUF502 domain-containing protein [Selenomonas sp. oral taxon 126]ANR70766.1 hypothetical protein AXF19_07085 [Selenomonas sp. oral taxon 126]
MTLRLNKLYRRTMKQVSRSFVNGLLVLVPVIITLLVIEWTLRFTEGVLGQYLPFYFPGMGIITLVLVIYAVGWASTNWALAKLIAFGENMIGTIPFVKFIYTSVKRLSEAVLDSSSNFKRVVHVPYQGARALGFVMADLPPRFQAAMGGGYICVFVPWSLNMTSGTTLLVKEEDAVTIDIPKEEALQYMLTAGAVMPLAERKKKSLPKKSAQSPADGVQEAED